MINKDSLRIRQTEDSLKPLRKLATTRIPSVGWIRTIREALGMTNVQLASRLKVVPQTIEDLQKYEATGKITLESLRKLANALDCQLIYAVIPSKPIYKMRVERARTIARRQLERASHSMKLEAQGVGPKEEKRQFERLVEELLNDNPKKLWD